jgi:hypothetical protein
MVEVHEDAGEIVIVMGPGRSGTSTVAGTLHYLGYHVPGQAIRGNRSNPSGFFEPRWVVDFHSRLLHSVGVRNTDSAPGSLERTRRIGSRRAVRAELEGWLAEQLAGGRRLVVKDPRSVWFHDLWAEVSRGLGVEPGFVTMLRHPAEVSASRQAYYGASDAASSGRSAEVARIASWVNIALITEQVTRGSARTFVRYTDLVQDWRTVMARVQRDLGLTFEPGLDVRPHPVDDFIDPSLYRLHVEWDNVDVSPALRDLGERVWTAMSGLSDGSRGPESLATLSALWKEYHVFEADAVAIARPAIRRAFAKGERKGRRATRKDVVPPPRPALPRRLWSRVLRSGR